MHQWWVWPSWLRRQIVALEIEGSSPFTHPFFIASRRRFASFILPVLLTAKSRKCYYRQVDFLMGRRQAVRHRILIPAFVSSNLTGPDKPLRQSSALTIFGTIAQSVEHLTFNQVVAGSIPACLTLKDPKGFFLFYITVHATFRKICHSLLGAINPRILQACGIRNAKCGKLHHI